jgi:hypothetical protein
MEIRPNLPNVTSGIHGRNLKVAANYLAEQSRETLDVVGSSVREQVAVDLKTLHRAVASRESEAGRSSLQSTTMQAASMAAGALLGHHGVVIHSMAEQLREAVSNPKSLQKLADQVSQMSDPDSKSGQVFSGLSNTTLRATLDQGTKPGAVGTGLFLAGGFLAAEQSNGQFQESLSQAQSPWQPITSSDGFAFGTQDGGLRRNT